MQRCRWVTNDPLYIAYHDHEWGVPVYDDAKLFEMLILEGVQAGLSWLTVLKKRENYRQAFAGFAVDKVAAFTEEKIAELMLDNGLIRNRRKLFAAVANARAFQRVQAEYGSFARYIWQFVDDEPRNNSWPTAEAVPAWTAESQAMSRALTKRGFKFVGPTICYSFMQAVGMVNDHTLDCFRYHEIAAVNLERRNPKLNLQQ